MKFLLTSGGISNDSIRNALVDLLGKPIAESSAAVSITLAIMSSLTLPLILIAALVATLLKAISP